MKSYFLLFALIFSTLHLQAQTEKGRFMLSLHNFAPVSTGTSSLIPPSSGLGFMFGKSTDEIPELGIDSEQKYFSFGLNNSIHYFIIDNLSAGINLNFYHSKSKYNVDDVYSNNIFMAGPELRYYFPVGRISKIYGKGGASFGVINTKLETVDDRAPEKLSQYGGGAGFAIFPADKISINIGVSYYVHVNKHVYEIYDVTTTTSAFAFDVGFSIFLGGE